MLVWTFLKKSVIAVLGSVGAAARINDRRHERYKTAFRPGQCFEDGVIGRGGRLAVERGDDRIGVGRHHEPDHQIILFGPPDPAGVGGGPARNDNHGTPRLAARSSAWDLAPSACRSSGW